MKTAEEIIKEECDKYGGFVNVINKCGGTLVHQIIEKCMKEYASQTPPSTVSDEEIEKGGTRQDVVWLAMDIYADQFKPKWVDVTERLPEGRMVNCLVFNGDAPEYNQHVFQATYFEQGQNFSTRNKYMGTITKWLPLPEQPDK